MKVLMDISVLIDITCRWRERPASFDLYNRIVANPAHTGTLAASVYTALYTTLSQLLGTDRARAVSAHFRETLNLLPFTASTAQVAHLLQISDLEAACVAATAFEGHCDIIVTRHINDFTTSPIPAKLPEDLIISL